MDEEAPLTPAEGESGPPRQAGGSFQLPDEVLDVLASCLSSAARTASPPDQWRRPARRARAFQKYKDSLPRLIYNGLTDLQQQALHKQQDITLQAIERDLQRATHHMILDDLRTILQRWRVLGIMLRRLRRMCLQGGQGTGPPAVQTSSTTVGKGGPEEDREMVGRESVTHRPRIWPVDTLCVCGACEECSLFYETMVTWMEARNTGNAREGEGIE